MADLLLIYSGELFRRFMDALSEKERNPESAVVTAATCVFKGARACQSSIPLKELCAELDVDKSSISKINKKMQELKSAGKLTMPLVDKGNKSNRRTTVEIFAERYANKLKLGANVIHNLKIISRRVAEKNAFPGKQPTTIAAVCIYLACMKHGNEREKTSCREIANVSLVSEATINSVFSEHIRSIHGNYYKPPRSCPKCKKDKPQNRSMLQWWNHIRHIHPHACDYCCLEFTRKQQLKEHLQSYHHCL